MNSDSLQELWRQQPIATAPVDSERLLAQIRTETEEWEREFDRHERITLRYPLFLVLIQLPGMWRWPEDFIWGQWLAMMTCLLWAGMTFAFRWRRLRLERDYQASVLKWLERMGVLLRQRMALNHASMIFVVPLAVSIGLMPVEMASAGAVGGLAMGAAAALLLGWWFNADRRKEHTRLAQRLAALELVRSRFTAASEREVP